VAAVDASARADERAFSVVLRVGGGDAEGADAFLERCAAASPSPILGHAPVPLRVGNRFLWTERPVLAAEVSDSEAAPIHRCACTLFRGRLYALELELHVDEETRVTVLAAHDFTGRRSSVANFRLAFLAKTPKRKREARATAVGEEVRRLVERRPGSVVVFVGPEDWLEEALLGVERAQARSDAGEAEVDAPRLLTSVAVDERLDDECYSDDNRAQHPFAWFAE